MKLSTTKETLLQDILQVIKVRAQDESKRSRSAKTLREELVYTRGFRVLSDLYNDLHTMEVKDGESK